MRPRTISYFSALTASLLLRAFCGLYKPRFVIMQLRLAAVYAAIFYQYVIVFAQRLHEDQLSAQRHTKRVGRCRQITTGYGPT